MIIAVTGHRPNKLGGYRVPNPHYNSIMTGLDRVLLELQPTRVIVGMALGVDQWMAELCIFNGIPFIAAIPFLGFEEGGHWYESNIRKYRSLLAAAEQVVAVSDPPYEPYKMQRRNEWMVDHCDLLLAVFDGTPGGTANCVNYAQQVRRAVRRIDYLRPPVVQERERRTERPTLTITEGPRVLPPDVQRNERPPSEGQRAAQRRARRELEEVARREERERQIERQRTEARARRLLEAQQERAAEDEFAELFEPTNR